MLTGFAAEFRSSIYRENPYTWFSRSVFGPIYLISRAIDGRCMEGVAEKCSTFVRRLTVMLSAVFTVPVGACVGVLEDMRREVSRMRAMGDDMYHVVDGQVVQGVLLDVIVAHGEYMVRACEHLVDARDTLDVAHCPGPRMQRAFADMFGEDRSCSRELGIHGLRSFLMGYVPRDRLALTGPLLGSSVDLPTESLGLYVLGVTETCGPVCMDTIERTQRDVLMARLSVCIVVADVLCARFVGHRVEPLIPQAEDARGTGEAENIPYGKFGELRTRPTTTPLPRDTIHASIAVAFCGRSLPIQFRATMRRDGMLHFEAPLPTGGAVAFAVMFPALKALYDPLDGDLEERGYRFGFDDTGDFGMGVPHMLPGEHFVRYCATLLDAVE